MIHRNEKMWLQYNFLWNIVTDNKITIKENIGMRINSHFPPLAMPFIRHSCRASGSMPHMFISACITPSWICPQSWTNVTPLKEICCRAQTHSVCDTYTVFIYNYASTHIFWDQSALGRWWGYNYAGYFTFTWSFFLMLPNLGWVDLWTVSFLFYFSF